MTPSELDLVQLFERSPVGMYRSMGDGTIRYANPALARLLGYSVEELLQKNMSRDVYADPEERGRLIEKHGPPGVVEGVETEWKTRDGHILTVQIWGHVVSNDPHTFDASVLDVTSSKRQRQDLEHTARILEAVVHQMPALYWLLDTNLTLIRTGGALQELMGYSSSKMMGLSLEEAFRRQPGSVDVLDHHRRALAGEVVPYDIEYQGKDLAVSVAPHRNAAGEIIGAVGTAIDVTDRMRQHRDVENTARILDTVLHQMPAVYWVVDNNLMILRDGGAAEEIFGPPWKSSVGQTLEESMRGQATSAEALAYHRRALAGETVSYDLEFLGKQVAATVAPHRNRDGVIIGAIGAAIDVTAARRVERRLIEAQRAESLGVLAGGLAHDFNNLLVAVIGNADLALREIPRGTPGTSAIENIRDAGLRAAELTDQLLSYAGRGGAGTTRVYPAPIVDELLRITATSFPADVKISVEIPSTLSLRGDPAQFRQVVMNLINNARDALAGQPGSIAIRASAVHYDGGSREDMALTAPAGNYVELEISDDGPGMDDVTRRHVFEPFFTTKHSGHGLGLAATLGIVRAHGGGLRVRSRPGAGASFTVLWPAATTSPHVAPTPHSPTRTVLVIDDEDLVRDVVARMIEDLGYAAITAGDGVAGLALLERESVDAVLVDLTMPQMSGADVIEALRVRRPGLPVILCSGFDRDGRGPVQADAYLPKPFRIDVLQRTLAKLLST